MSFMAGITSIQVRPEIAPANKVSDEVSANKTARQARVLAAVPRGVSITVDEVAELLKLPVTLVRADVNDLITRGKLADSWEGKYRYIRRSTL